MSVTSSHSGPRIEAEPWYTSSPYEPVAPPITRLDQIDLLNQEFYRQGDPHAAWRLLREKAPVFWHERPSPGTEDKGFWVLSRYDDAVAVYRNARLFSSEEGPFLDLRADQTPRRMLASIDGPEHRMTRSVVTRYFTPNAANDWIEAVRRIVNSLLDSVAERGECDFSVDIADKLPVAATCELLGISNDEAKSLAAMLFEIDPNSPDGVQAYNDAALSFFSDIAEERRRTGSQRSIIDTVAHAEFEGGELTRERILHLMWILFFGGIDSTVHAATGGMLSLFHHPDQLDLLRRDPSLAATAIDEILRWTSTSHANKRKAREDVEIRGTTIRKGDYVSMWSPSANRDETAYPDPYRFDVRRTMGKAIATFGGGGPHQCLGQFFARMELRILFEELLKRFPGIEQSGPAIRHTHFTMLLSPITNLPVRFTAQARSQAAA